MKSHLDQMIKGAGTNDFGARQDLVNAVSRHGGLNRADAENLLVSNSNGLKTRDVRGFTPSARMTGTSATQFNVTFERPTATMAGVELPVVLGNQNGRFTQWKALINGMVSGYVGYKDGIVGVLADADKGIFTFSDGTNTDVVNLTSSTRSYPELANGLLSTQFVVGETLFVVNSGDVHAGLFFKNNIDILERTIMGKNTSMDLPLTSEINAYHQNENVRSLFTPYEITQHKGLALKIPAVAGFSMTMTFKISKFIGVR